VQSQTGIPYLLIDGRFNNTATALRLLGSILGVDKRAEGLAARAQAILDGVDHVVAAVPEARRPRVYLAHCNNGLETGNRGSINTEIIERAGGRNVVDGAARAVASLPFRWSRFSSGIPTPSSRPTPAFRPP